MSDTEQNVLEVENLVMRFPLPGGRILTAVDGVSFSLRPGETLGLVGESGCGKTSLARAILRLYEPTSGTVRVDGENWTGVTDRRRVAQMRRKMQMVFQDPYASLDPRQTVASAIIEPMKVAGLYRTNREYEERCLYLMDRVGLSSHQMFKFPHEFSGGQLQRVGIARALALAPKIMIADEPVSALDVSIRAQVLNLFKELQREFNLALIFVSHDLALVRHMAHRIAVMYLGSFVEFGGAEAVCESPTHPYTKMLIGSIPHPNPRLRGELLRIPAGDLPSPLDIPSGCAFRGRCPEMCELGKEGRPDLVKAKSGSEVKCHVAR